ncbi:MAG: hypothetical protein ACXVAY_14500 [Mucilaginibacter sp.]
MECSESYSLILTGTGILISALAFYVSYLVHKSTVITNIQNVLTEKAKECNRQIIEVSHKAPETFAAISVVLTNIIYANRLLEMFRKDHKYLLFNTSNDHFVKFFYLQLHTSNVELVKNDLQFPPDTGNLNILQAQHQECKAFLKRITEENPSHPTSLKKGIFKRWHGDK